MVQYSNEILNTWGGPYLSNLTECGAKELQADDYHMAGIWNTMYMGLRSYDVVILNLIITILRRTNNAVYEYKSGQDNLTTFIKYLKSGSHRLDVYHRSLSQFEHCVSSVYQAYLSYDDMENHLLEQGRSKPKLFKSRDGSDVERLNQIYNCAKHFDSDRASRSSSPVWITNTGLECYRGAKLSFDELLENIHACVKICRESLVDIPTEFYNRSRPPNTDS